MITLSASSHKHLLKGGLLSHQHQESGNEEQEEHRRAAQAWGCSQGFLDKAEGRARSHLLTALPSPKVEVDFLIGIALNKIAFILCAYLMDLFCWKTSDGTLWKDTYNLEW